MTIHIYPATVNFLGTSGHCYEVTDEVTDDTEHVLASGWAAGSEQRARHEATEHARRVIRMRERARAAHLTGE